MRSTDEQIREIMKRAEHKHEKRSSQRVVASLTVACCACIAFLVLTALYLPGMSTAGTSQANGHYGSLLLNTSYMGYVVIGVIAFVLGICVTMLCLYLRRMRKKECDRS